MKDVNKMTREELLELINKSRSGTTGKVFELELINGATFEVELHPGVFLPVKAGGIMVDKRSAAVLVTLEDTIFGVKKFRKDVASLLSAKGLSPEAMEQVKAAAEKKKEIKKHMAEGLSFEEAAGLC